MAEDDKDWLMRLSHPLFPLGLEITRMMSLKEIPEALQTVKDRLPEWRYQVIDLNRIIRDLDKAARKQKEPDTK